VLIADGCGRINNACHVGGVRECAASPSTSILQHERKWVSKRDVHGWKLCRRCIKTRDEAAYYIATLFQDHNNARIIGRFGMCTPEEALLRPFLNPAGRIAGKSKYKFDLRVSDHIMRS
jgi:hypothetical protein